MDEALTAFAFDEEINELRTATADGTVQFVVDSLWFHYDDCKDHLAGLSKPEWDYFQRLILLLESDAEIERLRQRRWSVRQVVAGIALIGFGLCVSRIGIGWHLLGFALLFGPVSILLSYWRNCSERRQAEERLRLAPFSVDLRTACHPYGRLRLLEEEIPGWCQDQEIHSRLMTMAVWLQTAVLWSFISPLILLFQTLPEKEMHTQSARGIITLPKKQDKYRRRVRWVDGREIECELREGVPVCRFCPRGRLFRAPAPTVCQIYPTLCLYQKAGYRSFRPRTKTNHEDGGRRRPLPRKPTDAAIHAVKTCSRPRWACPGGARDLPLQAVRLRPIILVFPQYSPSGLAPTAENAKGRGAVSLVDEPCAPLGRAQRGRLTSN